MLAVEAPYLLEVVALEIVGKHEVFHVFQDDRRLDLLHVLVVPYAEVDDVVDFLQ